MKRQNGTKKQSTERNSKLRRIFTNKSIKNIAAVILTLLVSFVCSMALWCLATTWPIFKPWLGFVSETNSEWYIQTFYNHFNSISTEKQCDDVAPDIYLLDLDKSITRGDIAEILQLAASSNCHPKAVGLDCIFENNNSYDTTQTKILVSAIKGIPKTFPIAYAYLPNKPSAVPDELMLNKAHVEFSDFYSFNPTVSGYSHMAVELARLANYNVDAIDMKSFMTNYRTKEFYSYTIKHDSINLPYVRDMLTNIVFNNNIVIIGDLSNPSDIHTAPFNIESTSSQIGGTKIIAYILTSIISASSNDYDEFIDKDHYHHYERFSLGDNILVNTLFAIFFLFIYWGLDKLSKEVLTKWPTIKKLLKIIVSISTFLLLCWIFWLSMQWYTERRYGIPNVTPFILMSSFITYFYELFKPQDTDL